MFDKAFDLVDRALEMLEHAKEPGLSDSLKATLELSAALLCSQTWDWLCEERRRVTGEGRLPKSATQAFRNRYPDWGPLRDIANGFKHAQDLVANPDNRSQSLDWEQRDFWSARYGGPTLSVKVDGEFRSIRALVKHFSEALRADPPPLWIEESSEIIGAPAPVSKISG